MSHEADTMIGLLAAVHTSIDELRDDISKAVDRGAVSGLFRLSWDPAVAGQEAAEYDHEGRFRSIGIFNLSAATIRVAFKPRAGNLPAGQEDLTLSARGFIVLPVDGVTVTVSGAAAGVALVVPCSVPQPLNAGTF